MPIPRIGLSGIPVKCTQLPYAQVGLVRALQTKLMNSSSCLRKPKGNKKALPNAADRLLGVPGFE